MPRGGRKIRGKLTVLQGALQHNPYGDEELSKKLSKIFLIHCPNKI